MKQGFLGAAIVALLLGLPLLGITPVVAGDGYVAWPYVNPNYLSPRGPEGPWGHVPVCQVIVKTAHTVGAVTPDDLFYCKLAPLASWRPSDPCRCYVSDGVTKHVRAGMVYWRPMWWSPVTWLEPYP
jgi:hypothetical protein